MLDKIGLLENPSMCGRELRKDQSFGRPSWVERQRMSCYSVGLSNRVYEEIRCLSNGEGKELHRMISIEAEKAKRRSVIRTNRARMATTHAILLERQGKRART